jgi:hypothetical protein
MLGQEALVAEESLPNVLCGSDHLPIGAAFHFLPASLACLPEPPIPDKTAVSPEVLADWQRLLQTGPPKPRGRPNPEEMAALRTFAAAKKAFLDQLPAKMADVVKKIKLKP